MEDEAQKKIAANGMMTDIRMSDTHSGVIRGQTTQTLIRDAN
jgi:hypothetical protein